MASAAESAVSATVRVKSAARTVQSAGIAAVCGECWRSLSAMSATGRVASAAGSVERARIVAVLRVLKD